MLKLHRLLLDRTARKLLRRPRPFAPQWQYHNFRNSLCDRLRLLSQMLVLLPFYYPAAAADVICTAIHAICDEPAEPNATVNDEVPET